MGSNNIKRVVGDTVANYIATQIPALVNTATGQSGPETNFATPAVRLSFETLTFNPENFQEEYEATPDDGKLVMDVGEFDGILRIELWAKTKPERELYEQQILDLFLSNDQFAPGTISLLTPTLTINQYVSLFQAEVRVWLDQTDWQEEMSFEGHRYSFIDCVISYPALTSINAVNITSLQIWLSTDNEDPFLAETVD